MEWNWVAYFETNPKPLGNVSKYQVQSWETFGSSLVPHLNVE